MPPQNGQIPNQTFDLSAGVVPPTQTGKFDLSAGLSQPQNPASSIAPSFGASDLFGETLKGIGKGALKTGTEAGEAVNSMLPADALQVGIPATTLAKGEELSKPSNEMQSLGMGVEDVGEWMAGDEALKGIFKLTKLAAHAPGAIHLAEKYPKTARLLMGTGRGAAIGGAKGALKGESTGKVGEEALGGAEGGAVGGAVAEGASMALGGVGKAAGIGTEPTEDAIRAARPTKWNKDFVDNWKKAAPELVKEMDANGTFSDMKEAGSRIREAANDYWTREAKARVAAVQGNSQPVLSVAQKLEDAANQVPKIGPANVKKAQQLRDLAAEFRNVKNLTIGEIEPLIESNNNSLRATGAFERSSSARKAMIEADGNLKGAAIANEELRNLMMTQIPELASVKEVYGAMSNIATQVEGQANVAARQAPISMKRIIGLTGGLAGHPGAAVPAIFDYFYNSPEKLLTRAVQKEGAAMGAGGTMQKVKSAVKTGAIKTAQATPKAVGEKVGETLKEEKSSQ